MITILIQNGQRFVPDWTFSSNFFFSHSAWFHLERILMQLKVMILALFDSRCLFLAKLLYFLSWARIFWRKVFLFVKISRNEIPLKFSVTNSHFWQQPLWSLGGSQDILKVQTLPLGFEETSFGRIPSDSHASCRATYIHKFSQVAKIVLYVVLIYKFQTSSPNCR